MLTMSIRPSSAVNPIGLHALQHLGILNEKAPPTAFQLIKPHPDIRMRFDQLKRCGWSFLVQDAEMLQGVQANRVDGARWSDRHRQHAAQLAGAKSMISAE